jgi:hypothetical protein
MPEVKHVDDLPKLDTLPGLQQLTANLPAKMMEPALHEPKIESKTFGTRKVFRSVSLMACLMA